MPFFGGINPNKWPYMRYVEIQELPDCRGLDSWCPKKHPSGFRPSYTLQKKSESYLKALSVSMLWSTCLPSLAPNRVQILLQLGISDTGCRKPKSLVWASLCWGAGCLETPGWLLAAPSNGKYKHYFAVVIWNRLRFHWQKNQNTLLIVSPSPILLVHDQVLYGDRFSCVYFPAMVDNQSHPDLRCVDKKFRGPSKKDRIGGPSMKISEKSITIKSRNFP